MWQRYNQDTHIFEKSTDNGAIWTPLGLSGAIITEGQLTRAVMPTGVAYRDFDNNFVAQTIASGLVVKGANIIIQLEDPGGPVNGKIWRMIQYQGDAMYRFECLTDGGGAIAATPFQIHRSGSVYVQNDVVQLGRSQAMGNWIQYSYNPYDWTTWLTGVIWISVVGKTVTMVVAASGTIPAGQPYLRMSLPAYGACPITFNAVHQVYSTAAGWVSSPALFQAGQAFLDFYYGPGNGTFPAGAINLRMTCAYPIA